MLIQNFIFLHVAFPSQWHFLKNLIIMKTYGVNWKIIRLRLLLVSAVSSPSFMS